MPRTKHSSRRESYGISEWEDTDIAKNSEDDDERNGEVLNDDFSNLLAINEDSNYNLLHQVNKRVSLETLFNKIGIKFEELNSPSGWNLKALCPFKDHHDKRPSFGYNQSENVFNCFGCSRAGGPAQFTSYYEDIDLDNAINKLIPLCGGLEEENEVHEQHQFLSSINDLLFQFADMNYQFLHDNKFSDQAFDYAKNINMLFDFYIQNSIRNKSFNREGIIARLNLCKQKLQGFI